MAMKGITGAKNIFDESEVGFFNLYHAGCDREVLLGDLGQKFEMYDMGFKPYPCCRLNHRFIDAVIKFVKDNKMKTEELEELNVSVCKGVYEVLCTPLQEKKEPKSIMAAQFSLPWTLACGVVRQKVGIREFSEEGLRDPALLKVAAKVNPILDAALPDEHAFSKIQFKTKNEAFEIMTNYPRGSIENPMGFDDLGHKLMDCASIASMRISDENLARVITMVMNLEHVDRVDEIMHLLV